MFPEENPMRLRISSVFNCPAESVWAEVQTSSLLVRVMFPLLRFVSVDPRGFPQRWRAGTTERGRAYVFGIIPLGVHQLHFERVDQAQRQIQTREKNRWVRRWDHLISVQENPGNKTLYCDEVEIQAGWLTGLVWLYAFCFYYYRQLRWRGVVRQYHWPANGKPLNALSDALR
jgi:hypothetical protein